MPSAANVPSRRYVVWLVAALLVAWCTNTRTFAAAALADDAALSACEGEVPYYAPEQVTATRDFLMAFAEQMFPLILEWECSNFCALSHVTCLPTGVEFNASGAEISGELPAVPATVDGANVVVTKIDFSGNDGVSDVLPPSWSSLSALTVVSVADTSIGGAVPPSWSALTNLEYVDLSTTQIATTLPSEWGSMTKLQVFRAANLVVADALPSSWSGMSALTELDLHSCGISGTLPASWGDLTQLKTLRVNSNSLTGPIPDSYGGMTSIATVALESNGFCGCLPPAWTSPTSTVKVSADATVTAGTCATTHSCTPTTPSSSSSSSSVVPPPSSSSGTSSSDVCNAAVPFYNAAQVAATQAVLNALRSGFAMLESVWQCSNYCSWAGVECSADGIAVEMSRQNLQGTLAEVPAVADMHDIMLTSLDLSFNPGLTGSLPAGWLLMPNLVILNVSGCSISGTLPDI